MIFSSNSQFTSIGLLCNSLKILLQTEGARMSSLVISLKSLLLQDFEIVIKVVKILARNVSEGLTSIFCAKI